MSERSASFEELLELAPRVIRMAVEGGATGAECTMAEGSEFQAGIRKGEVENLKEAGSRAAGLCVLMGKCTGSAYTSDLTEAGLRYMVSSALSLARITTEDPYAGLPSDFGKVDGDLQLHSADIAAVTAAEKIARAKAGEAAAFAFDARITNSEGASIGTYEGARVFANSLGFSGGYRASSASGSVTPVAQDGEGKMQRDFWYTAARRWSALESPETVGRKAAEMTLRRLGSRSVPTQKVPVIFDQRTARGLLSHIFDAVDGDSIYRDSSFLTGKLGQKIAASGLTVIDDATIPGLFGSQPFDDEGVKTRRTVVIRDGVLESYLLNTYTARKLGMQSTGNASRGLSGAAGVGNGNLYIEQGAIALEDMIGGVKNGFFVTELIGFGVNTVTGDYSRGAAGLWIENGELTYAVSEVTIAGNLKEMLLGIEAIADNLEFRGSIAAPSLLIREMTVSGKNGSGSE